MGAELGMVMKMARNRLIIRNGRHIMSVTSFIITRRKINREEEEEVEEEEVIEVVEVNLSLIKMVVEEVEVEEETIRIRESSSISRASSISLNNKCSLVIFSSIMISNNNTAIRTIIINTIITIMAKDINNRSIKKSHTTRKKG